MEYADFSMSEKTPAARIAFGFLTFIIDEYTRSTLYFKSINAQTPSHEYGGSRSVAYLGMLASAESLPDMLAARREFKARHQPEEGERPYSDERGGLLRIAGYHLRNVPLVGQILENQVRADDVVMAAARFAYPDELI